MIDREKIEELIKKSKLSVLCVLGGFALFAVVTVVQPGKTKDIESIERAGYGSSKQESLYVEGLEDDTVQVDISVAARQYTDEEIDGAMENCVSSVAAQIPGDNTSLHEVSSDLVLPDYDSEYGFNLTWNSDDRELIDSMGRVSNEELTKPEDVVLTLTVSSGKYSRDYVIPVTVLPRQLTESEKRMKGFMKLVEDADKQAATSPRVELPKDYEGRKLRFRDSEDISYHFIWILGIVIAVLLVLRDKENSKTDLEKRYKQMQLDYSEIVSKLLLFVGAGMSVRMAWGAIASDYERDIKEREKAEVRYAYEELCKANTRLQTGAPEGLVYREYGRECHSKQYMKLASLLEQNRRSGLANMKNLLQLEMVEAWEERKNLALRRGEEASTKLLIPLVILLVIVMVIIMVPALMGFL